MKNLIIIFCLSLSIPLQAQFTRDQAINKLIEDVIGADSLLYHFFFSKTELMFENDTLRGDVQDTWHICPYAESWVFFIDDLPVAYWAHPCRWIFFDAESGEYHIIQEEWPPLHYLSNYELSLQEWEWIQNPVGINKSENGAAWMIYPNPADQQIEIEYPRVEVWIGTSIEISSVTGTPIKKYEIQPGDFSCKIRIDDLKPGFYLIRMIQQGEIVATEKLVKK